MLKVRSVVKLFVREIDWEKTKFCIIVGMNSNGDKAASIFINTETRTSALVGLIGTQVPLTLAHCPFLQYDSLADCSGLKEWKTHELNQAINRNQEVHVGYIQSSQFELIRTTIFRAKTIPMSLKREYQLITV